MALVDSNTYIEPTAGTSLNASRTQFNNSLRSLLTNFRSSSPPATVNISASGEGISVPDGTIMHFANSNVNAVSKANVNASASANVGVDANVNANVDFERSVEKSLRGEESISVEFESLSARDFVVGVLPSESEQRKISEMTRAERAKNLYETDVLLV